MVDENPPSSPLNVDPGPLQKSIALAIFLEFIKNNRVRLIDLFRAFDKTKDWFITKDKLKFSLKGAKIPLTDLQIEEMLSLFNVDNKRDHLKYKDLASAICTFQQSKRYKNLIILLTIDLFVLFFVLRP